ncbi:MAG: hypothetical protein K2L14_10570 [Duncaniella sp.]|nr:hypothetical protein [Duncaniella sp.]
MDNIYDRLIAALTEIQRMDLLSTPLQVQMALFALFCLIDKDDAYPYYQNTIRPCRNQ